MNGAVWGEKSAADILPTAPLANVALRESLSVLLLFLYFSVHLPYLRLDIQKNAKPYYGGGAQRNQKPLRYTSYVGFHPACKIRRKQIDRRTYDHVYQRPKPQGKPLVFVNQGRNIEAQ